MVEQYAPFEELCRISDLVTIKLHFWRDGDEAVIYERMRTTLGVGGQETGGMRTTPREGQEASLPGGPMPSERELEPTTVWWAARRPATEKLEPSWRK